MYTRRLALGAAALLATPAILRAQTVIQAAPGTSPLPSAPDLPNRLAASPEFSKFVELLQVSGMINDLRGTQPLTVFAPTNAAIDSIPAIVLQDLTGRSQRQDASPDTVRLRALVAHHVISGQHLSPEFLGRVQDVPSRNGGLVRVDGSGRVMTVKVAVPEGGASSNYATGAGGFNIQPPAEVVRADIMASNGVIHAINGVMIP